MSGKHILFVIHGMGVNKADWSKVAQNTLKTAFERYAPNEGAFDENIEIVEIVYDNIFEDYRRKWKEDTKLLKTNIALLGLGDSLIDRIVNIVGGPAKDNFATTHLLDALMYKVFPTLIGRNVAIQIANDIIKTLPSDGSRAWSILAYSLGTAAAYNALQTAYTWADHPLKAEHTGPNVVMMVANVSRLFHGDDVFSSPVRPGPTNGNHNICRNYFTARNLYDPIPKIKRFDCKTNWPSEEVVDDGGYKAIMLRHIEGWNVHDLEHYLNHPTTSIELFRGMFHNDIVSEKTAKDAVSAYHPNISEEEIQTIASGLKSITGIDFPDFIKSLLDYSDLINKIKGDNA